MEELFEIVKDAAILIMLVTTIEKLRKDGSHKYYKILFIFLLFLL